MEQLSPRDVVSAEAPKRVRYWRQSPEGWNPLAALSSVSRKVAHEYKNRFVLELLQNAHDAQDPFTSVGEVQLVLDAAEGEHGVFYAANTGKPFTQSNFEALSNIARSSKPPGEGIGNKGLGFRSVLQVCEQPEIYSASPVGEDDGFRGYCFGFATDEEMRGFAKDEAEAESLRHDFSRHLLPVPRHPQDRRLFELRGRGAVTVVRLPLATADALDSCRDQLQALRCSRAPTLLFMDRVRSVSIEVSGCADAWYAELVRTRRPCAVGGLSEDVECSEVAFDDQRYLVASRRIASERVLLAIDSGIRENELDEDWKQWEGDAEVSLAVRMAAAETEQEQPTLYTFLPMRVDSPCGAHLIAPFYTNIARVDFAANVGLNAMLLDEAMRLAGDALIAITSEESEGLGHRAGISVDLFSWRPDYLDRFAQVLSAQGVDLVESLLLPTGRSRWSSLADAYSWQSTGLSLLDAERLNTVGAHIVDDGIGARRLSRLEAAARHATGASLSPPDEVVAQWMEQVAERLIEHRSSIEEWNRFYEDMAALFQSGRRPGSLRGRRILLDANRRLRRAGPADYDGRRPSDPVVFVPPRLRSDEDQDVDDDFAEDPEELKVPRSLNRAICFLHPEIQLLRRDGSTTRRTSIAELLEGRSVAERLAEPFGRRGIFAVIRRLLADRPTPAIRREALRWVYLQWRSARSGLSGLELLGLQVPTRGGWLPAAQARFSGEWNTPSAALLERLLAEAEGCATPGLDALRASLLVPPGELPGAARDVASWERFLSTIGVRDGLWPVTLRAGVIELQGNLWTPERLAQRVQLDERLAAAWSEHVGEAWPAGRTSYPYTSYTGEADLWILPGQEVFTDLPDNARRAYAELVASAVADWDPAQFSYRFQRRSPRHRGYEDRQVWPSPVRTFIERQAWFPMTDPLRRDDPYGVPIGEGWHFDESDGERAPRFARMCSVSLRRRIDASPSVLDALRSHGLRVWNDPSSGLARLEELATLLEQGFVDGRDTAQFRRSCEKAWSDVQRAPITQERVESLPLVVGRDRELHVLHPNDGQRSQVYVEDGSAGLSLRIVEASGKNILVSDAKDGKELVNLLSNRTNLTVQAISDVAADIVTDIGTVVPAPTAGDLCGGSADLAFRDQQNSR